MSDTKEERKSIFDIYCTAKTGERFIVEMQKAKIHCFKDRSLFYSTFPVREQAQKGEWDFYLLPVYFIAVLDFQYDEKEDERKFRRDVCLKDQDGDVFYDKLHFKFLQMPLFNKQEHELESHFDKWVYFLKHLEDFDHIPAILNEPIFQKGFDIAEVSHLSSEQYDAYLKSQRGKRRAGYCTVGWKARRKVGNTKTMLFEGFDVATVARITKLKPEEIKVLK
jgi:predicted transposase/invertase (TIGR01784 family)